MTDAGEEVPVCPACSSTHIRRRGPRGGQDSGGAWWCRDCRENFDEPDYRERKSTGRSAAPTNGIAAKLARIGEERDGDAA